MDNKFRIKLRLLTLGKLGSSKLKIYLLLNQPCVQAVLMENMIAAYLSANIIFIHFA